MEHKILFSSYKSVKIKTSPHNIDMSEFDNIIRTGNYEGYNYTECIRNLYIQKNIVNTSGDEAKISAAKEEIKRIKESELPCIVSSGTMKSYCNAENFETHNGLMQIDIDISRTENSNLLSPSAKHDLMVKLKNDPHVFRLLFSPSGGVKMLVPIPANTGTHLYSFYALQKHFSSKYSLKIDPACKNVDRLMYLSHDPSMYCNDNSVLFEELLYEEFSHQGTHPNHSTSPQTTEGDLVKVERYISRIVEAKLDITSGYTNWLKLGFSLCVFGERGVGLFLKLSQFHKDFNSEAALKQYHYCLKNNKGKITLGTFFHFCHEAGVFIAEKQNENSNEAKEIDFQTPAISNFVKENLPPLFKELFAITDRPREQDVAIIGALIFFSASLPNVFVIHDKGKSHINLYAFIAAISGTGKGVLEKISRIFKVIDALFYKRYQEAMVNYNHEYKLYLEATKNGMEAQEPLKPVRKNYYLSADSSRMAFLRRLDSNGGDGIMYEPEGDNLSNSFETDWGNFSIDLRKNFHQEDITSDRKDYVRKIEFPHFSNLNSGTPNQAIRFFEHSVEGGMFSRFMMYFFGIRAEWDETVFDPTGWEIMRDSGKALSERVEHLFLTLERRKEPAIFQWEWHQWEKLNIVFKQWFHQYKMLFGENSNGIIFRLGLMASRIAAILTVVRMFDKRESVAIEDWISENPNETKIIHCSSLDLEITIRLLEVLKDHTFAIYEFIMKDEKRLTKNLVKNMTMRFLEALPEGFQRKEAIGVAAKIGIPERTADTYLKKLIESNLLKRDDLKTGFYEKTNN